jgi:hypothetical protein
VKIENRAMVREEYMVDVRARQGLTLTDECWIQIIDSI